MRLVIDTIRGRDVNEAYALLKFSKKRAAKQIEKVLRSAVSNAEQDALRNNDAFERNPKGTGEIFQFLFDFRLGHPRWPGHENNCAHRVPRS